MDINPAPGDESNQNQPNKKDESSIQTNDAPTVNPDVGSVISPTNDATSAAPATGNQTGTPPSAQGISSDSNDQGSPQPFTMDDPNKLVEAPATPQQQQPTQEAMPKPFTMNQSDSTNASQSTASAEPATAVPNGLPETDTTQSNVNPPVSEQPAIPTPADASSQPATDQVANPAPKPNFTADGTPQPASTEEPAPSDTKHSSRKLATAGALLLALALTAGAAFIMFA